MRKTRVWPGGWRPSVRKELRWLLENPYESLKALRLPQNNFFIDFLFLCHCFRKAFSRLQRQALTIRFGLSGRSGVFDFDWLYLPRSTWTRVVRKPESSESVSLGEQCSSKKESSACQGEKKEQLFNSKFVTKLKAHGKLNAFGESFGEDSLD